jgi:hypothetical protein
MRRIVAGVILRQHDPSTNANLRVNSGIPMRLLSSLFVLLLVLGANPRVAQAAACCGTGHGLGQRLGPGETAAFTISSRFAGRFGSFDPQGNFFAIPSASFDGDVRADLLAVFAPIRRVQVSVAAPFVLNIKRFGDEHDTGGGIGDLVFSGRFDVVPLSTTSAWPAIAITTSFTLPTGRSANDAVQVLAADATGLGVAEFRPGVFLEKSFGGKVTAIVAASVGFRSETNEPPAPRVGLAPRWRLLAAAGPVFESGLSLSLGAIYEYEGAPAINGATIPESQRYRLATLGFVGYDLSARFTLLGSVELDVPIQQLSKNEAASAALSIGLRRSFF